MLAAKPVMADASAALEPELLNALFANLRRSHRAMSAQPQRSPVVEHLLNTARV